MACSAVVNQAGVSSQAAGSLSRAILQPPRGSWRLALLLVQWLPSWRSRWLGRSVWQSGPSSPPEKSAPPEDCAAVEPADGIAPFAAPEVQPASGTARFAA